jgi:DNA gyrase subunit A
MERPDLSGVTPEIIAYIEALEAELAESQPQQREQELSEPPTTLNVITISQDNEAKRTPRHFYGRQRRGGMGVFDLETAETHPPSVLVVADESESIVLFSNFGRAFRLPVTHLLEAPVRSAGQSLASHLPFRPHERIVAALPENGGAYAVLASQRGRVRRVRSNYLGRSLVPGMTFHDVKEGGYLVAACWTPGDGDLFVATRLGKGIRFKETQVHSQGTLGMRVDVDDAVVAITAVTESSGVFMMTNDGKGTIRLMSGFRANASPGAGGKVAMKTDDLVAAFAVTETDDIFAISQTSKMIRFMAEDVPPKEGVVQGVNCMALRNDVVTAVTVSGQSESAMADQSAN